MGLQNLSSRGSALVSTIAGVACAGLIASAGYALLGGGSLCSLMSNCDSGAKSGWTMASDGVVVMPAAMLETTEACDSDKASCADAKAECADAKAECADAGAVVVNAAQKSEECEVGPDCCAEKDEAASGAVVVNAAALEPATKSCCQEKAEKAKVVNVAVAAGECDAETDECLEEPMQTSPAGIATVNTTCPLTDEPITPGLASLHEGFTVGFCCNGCKRKWDARTADEKASYIVSNARVVNEMCPTCPTMKPSGSNVALFEGFAVGFCNSHCQSTFEKKDHAAKAAYVASVAKPVNDVCPNSGKAITVNASAVYRGAVVGFCNAGCRDKFDAKTPAAEKDATLVRLVSKNFESAAQACANGCCAGKTGNPAD